MRVTTIWVIMAGLLLAGCRESNEEKAKQEILDSQKTLSKEIDQVAAGKKQFDEKRLLREGTKVAESLKKIKSYKKQGELTRQMVALRREFSGLFTDHQTLLTQYTALGGATKELLLSPAKMKQVITNRKALITTNTALLTKIPGIVAKVTALLKRWKSEGENPMLQLFKDPNKVFAMDIIVEMLKLEKLAGAKEIERLELVLKHPGKVKLTKGAIDIADAELLKKFNTISNEYAAILKKIRATTVTMSQRARKHAQNVRELSR